MKIQKWKWKKIYGEREVGHKWTSGKTEKIAKTKARKWPDEKQLLVLDKCDGLATAAGGEVHEEGTERY